MSSAQEKGNVTVYDVTIFYLISRRDVKQARVQFREGVFTLIVPQPWTEQQMMRVIQSCKQWMHKKYQAWVDMRNADETPEDSSSELKKQGTLCVKDLDIPYRISRRSVRRARIEYRSGIFTVIIPSSWKSETHFVEHHALWMYRRYKKWRILQETAHQKKLAIERTRQEFFALIMQYMQRYETLFGVHAHNVGFRLNRTRWGSCNPKTKHITFNVKLQYLPETLIEHVVCHEVAHLVHRGHDKKFYELLRAHNEDPKKIRKELAAYHILVDEFLKTR